MPALHHYNSAIRQKSIQSSITGCYLAYDGCTLSHKPCLYVHHDMTSSNKMVCPEVHSSLNQTCIFCSQRSLPQCFRSTTQHWRCVHVCVCVFADACTQLHHLTCLCSTTVIFQRLLCANCLATLLAYILAYYILAYILAPLLAYIPV